MVEYTAAAVTPLEEPRRRIMHASRGFMTLFYYVQAGLQDIKGAWRAEQFGTAAWVARETILETAAVNSIAVIGEPIWSLHAVTFNPFKGLSENERDHLLALIASAAELARAEIPFEDPAVRAWWRSVVDYVVETEERLGFDQPLPDLRSPDGMYRAMSMGRGAFEALEELGLPSILPDDWTTRENLDSELDAK